jgi:hypothetical protein
MAASRARNSVAFVLAVGTASCTLTGLGNYAVDTCAQPTGTTTTLQPLGQIPGYPTFSSFNGGTPIAAFVGNECIEAVGHGGFLQSSCSLLGMGNAGTLEPEQPYVAPLGGGYAAVAVATTAPFKAGQLSFEVVTAAGGVSSLAQAPGTTGAALPAIVPLPDGMSALVAWYETPIATRTDPIQSCAAAAAAPLQIAVATGATGLSPSLGAPTMLTAQSISVRPPGVTTVPGGSQVLLVAPDGNAVSLWALDGATAVSPTTIGGLAQARAANVAVDGSGNIAVVAELGCAPQTIALAVGNLNAGFSHVTTVTKASGTSAVVQPTVAWVPSQSYWIVSWISTDGGAHVLGQRFDPSGNPVGSVIDPSASVLGGCVTSDGSVFAYQQPVGMNGSVLSVSLGCAQ